jgi:class 3 adenylate cyclase/tetratricopeptide (TPR) repeat protein
MKSPEPEGQTGQLTRAPERRQLTVMYCDMVDSTALFTELDPEEVAEVLRAYCQCCAEHIEAAGGLVAQFQGDGVIGFFGYTRATESDAEGAVRAALELIKVVPGLRSDKPLGIRIGISTGLAIVGDVLHTGTRLEQGAVGQALHLAARLQASASANEILIPDSTKRLTGRLFACQSKGRVKFKGISEPVPVWRVLGPRSLASRSGMRRDSLLIPMVNREAELEVMLQTWSKAVAGQGQVLDIIGAAGIGKSRLLLEFRHRISRDNHIWTEGAAAQFFANTPFYLVSQLIRRALDPGGRTSRPELRARLESALMEAGIEATKALPLITKMFGERLSGTELSLTPDERRELLSVLADWLVSTAQRVPLVIVVEDLHWIDPSSLETDRFISAKIGASRILVLRTMRPGYLSSQAIDTATSQLRLHPLNDDDLRQVISNAGDTVASLTERDVAKILQRAEGVPLFGIELARLVGAQQEAVGDHDIPATLAELIVARLDQLGSAKATAHIAAVIGDSIPLSLLEAVSDISAKRLRMHLGILQKHDVLVRLGGRRRRTYAFTHALLRDAAYSSLVKNQRQRLHYQVAKAVRENFAEVAASRPEFVAHHWTQAGEWKLAVAAWQKAGDFASARRGFQEATHAYQSGLSALRSLPESPERDSSELTLQAALADVLRITRGFSTQQTKDATARASTLADKLGNRTQQFLQMWGAWTAASSGGDYDVAGNVAQRFYQLALVDGSPNDLAHAYMMQMTARYRIGDLLGAEDYFRRGEQFFGVADFHSRPGVIAQTYGNATLIAWTLGDDAVAQKRIEHALRVAERNDNPFDRAYAEHMAAHHAVLAEEWGVAAAYAHSSIDLSDRHNFPQFAANSRVALGRAQAGLGAIAKGRELMREGLDRMAAASVRVMMTFYLAWLAEVHLLAGSFSEAKAAVDEALVVNPHELLFRPEVVRLRGEVARRLGSPSEAQRAFLESIALSKQMGAKRLAERARRNLKLLRREGTNA